MAWWDQDLSAKATVPHGMVFLVLRRSKMARGQLECSGRRFLAGETSCCIPLRRRIEQEQEMKGIQTGWEEVQFSLLAGDLTVYIDKS